MILISWSSCISSLHQLVTYDKVITDNRITGRWQQNDSSIFIIEDLMKSNFYKSISKVTVGNQEKNNGFDSKEDSLLYSKSYVLSFTKSGYNYTMIASLMRLDNQLYADLIPVSAAVPSATPSKVIDNLFDGTDYLPSHTIARILVHDASVDIKFLNGDFIEDQLAKGTLGVKYENDSLFNTSLITASPAELQQFLVKYGNDERLYNKGNTINLKKI
ncbi:MAG: hypothetical protein JWM28_265 [Chitinophagaceae bacterium]|nr:hypothetical protein [Chitinophagaceae bacterium]